MDGAGAGPRRPIIGRSGDQDHPADSLAALDIGVRAGGVRQGEFLVDDHFQLDFSAKLKLTDNIRVFYEWVNINNAKYFAFNRLGNQQNIYQYEEYNWTMKGGVRFTF